MARIKGITVMLLQKQKTGEDPFGAPIYDYVEVPVDNVLVTPTRSQEVLDRLNLTGRKVVYTLAIPKGDTHEWEEQKVIFFGKEWRMFGMELEGIEQLIPLDRNKKVYVERYE